jgi:hypothetical protein
MIDMVSWVECAKFRAWTRQQLQVLKPQYVVLSWSFQGHPWIPTNAAWENANSEYFAVLNGIGAQVLFFHDVPPRQGSVPDLVAGSPTDIKTRCTQPRQVRPG